MATNLRGCDSDPTSWMSPTNPIGEAREECPTRRWRLKVALVIILCLVLVMIRMFLKLTEKMEQLAQIREVIRFAQPNGGEPQSDETETSHLAEDGGEKEEDDLSPDGEVSEAENGRMISAGSRDRDTEGSQEFQDEFFNDKRGILLPMGKIQIYLKKEMVKNLVTQ